MPTRVGEASAKPRGGGAGGGHDLPVSKSGHGAPPPTPHPGSLPEIPAICSVDHPQTDRRSSMAKIRCQIQIQRAGDLPRDFVTNTCFFNVTEVPGIWGPADYQALAVDAMNAWHDFRVYPSNTAVISAKVYEMQDPEPREVRGYAARAVSNVGASAEGPREVALCLSFYSERNIPRRRGRLYIGPWASNFMTMRPSANVRQEAADLAAALQGIGGVDVDWQVYSRADNAYRKVTNWWVDDEWDTQRSRGLRATTRESGTTSE